MAYETSATIEDELQFSDIFLAVARRKWLFLFIIFIFFALGLSYAVLMPKKYQYTQLIELSNYQSGGGEKTYIQNPQMVSSLVTQIYLANVIRNYNQKNVKHRFSLKNILVANVSEKMNIKNSGGAYLSLMIKKGIEKNTAAYKNVFNDILFQINQRETPWISAKTKALHRMLTKDQAQLNLMNERYDNLVASEKSVDQLISRHPILNRYVVSKKNQSLEQFLNQAAFNQLYQYRLNLENEIHGVMSKKIELDKTIDQLQTQLSTMQNSHFVGSLERSVQSVSPPKIAIILLALILGFVFGFLGVLALNFFEDIKKRGQSV